MKERDLQDHERIRGRTEADESSLSLLFDRYGQTVYNLVYHIIPSVQEAEMLTQDVFLTFRQKSSVIDLQTVDIGDCILTMAREVAVKRSHARIQSAVTAQQLNGDSQNFVEKETERIKELSSVDPAALPNVLLSPEVKENILFTLHMAQIAEAGEQAFRESDESKQQTPKQQNTDGFWLQKKTSWRLIGKVFIALVITLGTAFFINADWCRQLLSQQGSRGVLFATEKDEQQNIANFFQARRLCIIVLAGLTTDSMVSGKMFWDPDQKTALFQFSNLPPTAPGKHYQLWIMRDSIATSVGGFETTKNNKSIFKIVPIDLLVPRKISAIELTVEPLHGVSKPAGEIMLLVDSPHLIIFG